MIRKTFTLATYIFLSTFFIFLNLNYNVKYGDNIQNSVITLAITYFIFKVLIEGFVRKHAHGYKERYSYSKAISIAYALVVFVIFVTIWAESVQALLVAYGLVAAGVALALQDVFKNFASGLLLITRGVYRVGDRIEIEDTLGDVIDIGILNTTILEIKNWVDGDQATGRIINVPNGKVLSQPVFNYTKDNLIIWDEIMIPLTYDSNWKKAKERFIKATDKITKDHRSVAENEISKLSSKYYLEKRDAKSVIYIKPTDNWMEIHIRYVTLARERRESKNAIYEKIMDIVDSNNNINIGSSTLDIIGLPNS